MGDRYVLTGVLAVLLIVCFGFIFWHSERNKRPLTEMEQASNYDTSNFDDVLRK